MCDDLAVELALSTLPMALEEWRLPLGILQHADHDASYAYSTYRELLKAHSLRTSMSWRANCWDNAIAESFYTILKLELIGRHTWITCEEVYRVISVPRIYETKRRPLNRQVVMA
jgi:putative transposase